MAARRERVEGAVLGAAIGDAMGFAVEFDSLQSIRARFGPDGVTGYTKLWERDGRRFAPFSDDTQMAEVVLRTLLDGARTPDALDDCMKRLAFGFIEWSHLPDLGARAPGNSCLAGCSALERGESWREAGGINAKGCGSVMRAYPCGLLFAPDEAARWAAAQSMHTHRHPAAIGASAGMAAATARAIMGATVDDILAAMIAATESHDSDTARMIERAIDDARSGKSPDPILTVLQGWTGDEALAAAAFVFTRHPDDPRAAILEASNTPGDSDSIATLVGALVGARCGLRALPADWIRDLERSDDLLALARAAAT